MVEITYVEPRSRAERAGICPGDRLLSIGGHEIEDVLDYRFYLADTLITLECEREGKRFAVSIKKGEYDDIGLGFKTPLMDEKHTCRNKCIFCFIDQLPKGLRDTLYFKDDDSRLSFLHGNYITLTNLQDKDIDRIVRMHISPVNVSVHTTNPTLRVQMMKNKRAGEVLAYLERFREAGIRICAQIVLCKGINDGAELDRSMRDLCAYLPALSSVSIVPAGLTRYREGLYPLEEYTPEDCRAIVAQVDAFGEECLKKHGTRLFFCADELYVKGGLALPEDEYYEEYAQIENGVGMLRALSVEFEAELSFLEEADAPTEPRTVSIATGVAAHARLTALGKLLEQRIPNLTVRVYKIVNRFFGETVTVTGLLTGKDLAQQLKGEDLGDELLLSSSTLRAEGDLFLCGMTPHELAEELNLPIRFVDSDGAALVRAILGTEV